MITVEILTPDGIVFNQEVFGIQLPGIDGQFEVLSKHAPLVSALKAGNMKVLLDKTFTVSKHFSITGGFVEVIKNKATILAEGATEIV